MRVFVCALAAAVVVSSTVSAIAATVSTQQGQVLVNAGQGYRQVAGAVQAGAGASVVANPGGLGQVTYPDGCTVTVEPGTVYTIAQESPCNAGPVGLNGTTFVLGAVAVGGIGAAAIIVGNKDKAASP